MDAVTDVDRPDVGGVSALMAGVAQEARSWLRPLVPHLTVDASDNLTSSVTIFATMDAKSEWPGGYAENGKYFQFQLFPPKGVRYYDPSVDRVTVELLRCSHRMSRRKFRRYTGPVAGCMARVMFWVAQNRLGLPLAESSIYP